MNNPLDDMLRSAGLNPADFSAAGSSRPVMSATTDPRTIHEAVSRPGTVYAAIQEDCVPEPVPTPDAVEIADAIEVADDTPSGSTAQLSDSDFDDILSSVGFHDDAPSGTAVERDDSRSLGGVENGNDEEDENEYNGISEESMAGEGEAADADDSGGRAAELSPNSPTLLIDDSTSRFSGAEWYDEVRKSKIILAGLGGIGSWTALCLARMSPLSLVLYDGDRVERANLSGQFYSKTDAGKAKATAVSDHIAMFTPMTSAYAIAREFTASDDPGNIMICGFDSMKARRMFFNSWCRHLGRIPYEQLKNCLFIDGRLSIDTLQVLAFRGDDDRAIDEYRSRWLFTDEEAEQTVCSLKQTSYMACMIGALITNIFVNFTAGSLNPVIPYDLPFLTEYNSQHMIFKTTA